MENKLKQRINEDKRISLIMGSVESAILCVLIVILSINRANEGHREIVTLLSFGTVAVVIRLIVVFVKSILLVCINSRKDLTEGGYEKARIVVREAKTKMSLRYGTCRSSVLVENLETGEQLWLDGCGDMKENETYCILRARHTKQFVYERFDSDAQ